ncbi:MAG TPA: class I SAM-dependent methyltransferase, partial [Vicinamibacterales bacterium]|nr:class I SAM-dependent methyltransferase [Vicinamibacterales bacterium]
RPIHYYEPLPDFRSIIAGATTTVRVSSAIDFDLDGQRRLVRRLGDSYRAELEAIAKANGFDFHNEYFAGLDAAVYYALVRDLRPARVIEIGSGMSTRIAAQALERNRADGHGGELVCIEPFPQPRLTQDMPAITLITEPVERLPLETFDTLQANDILFIDSSHAAKFGGDVCREFLEILPRLRPGVWVHVHDIFFPHDYPAEWLIEKRIAFNEQYVLEAFLAFNRSFSVRAANYWLALAHRAEAELLAPASLWPSREPACASFWMQRVA